MNTANAGGSRPDALPLVYAYNSAISDIVSQTVEPDREDFKNNVPVVVES